jgi:hypothetical protein
MCFNFVFIDIFVRLHWYVGVSVYRIMSSWPSGTRINSDLSVCWSQCAETTAVESESEGILGGVGVGKNVPTPTLTR